MEYLILSLLLQKHGSSSTYIIIFSNCVNFHFSHIHTLMSRCIINIGMLPLGLLHFSFWIFYRIFTMFREISVICTCPPIVLIIVRSFFFMNYHWKQIEAVVVGRILDLFVLSFVIHGNSDREAKWVNWCAFAPSELASV